MFVLVTRAGASPTTHEPDDLRRLHVEFRGVSDADGSAALVASGLGELDGDHVRLDVAALRDAGPDSDRWRTEFDAMIRYASEHGWTDAAVTRVRAHVERTRDDH